ncbi:hypothetical protein [Pelosinus sp. sgz500959]|uniref:hypothetical protein n=1 Tax=Pelosinus sp. sgz500959 TaxID=3242472 RepID=UPI00366A689C
MKGTIANYSDHYSGSAWKEKPEGKRKKTAYRSENTISAKGFFNRTQKGLVDLLKFEQELDFLPTLNSPLQRMHLCVEEVSQDSVERLVSLGECAAKSLDHIRQLKTKISGTKAKEQIKTVVLESTTSLNIGYVGYSVTNSQEILASLAQHYSQGRLAGLIYLGGFGWSADTSSDEYITIAKKLVERGYLVISAGCVSAALIASGLCHPNYNNGYFPLRDVLPVGTPPILHIGTSHDAGEFVCIAQAAGELPVFAILTGNEYNRKLVTAVAFATMGINTWIDQKNLFDNHVISSWLSHGLADNCGTQLLPFISVEDFLHHLDDAN